jgi:hypothetical protein
MILVKSFLAAFLGLLISSGSFSQIPTPREHFGFTPGDDRMMFRYQEMMDYMEKLAAASPMVHIEQVGESEMGLPMYIIFVSSEENITNLENLRQINRMLALDEIPEGSSVQQVVDQGKVFFLSTLSMHATEVGPMQALPLFVYELIAGVDPRREKILQDVVAMFMPHNPDGMNMIVDHYNKHKGTALETSHMPGVYHKYVGHNINRDFITLTQKENQAVADVYSTIWFPQAMVERHQMGSTGPRFYISPPHDPIAENVDPGIWNWMRVYGSRTLTEMTEAGLPSVSVNYLFDDYWPGATTTSIWKGIIGMLSEAAGVNIATPIYVEPNELQPTGKGLSQYAISINLPMPWKGGWWRLSDILRYELENTLSYLHTSAIHRSELLRFRNEISRREIKRGSSEPPYYYIFPLRQHDSSEFAHLVNLLERHGVRTYNLTADVEHNNRLFRAGDVVVPLSQPYRAFIKEVLEKQKFPARHYTPNGELIRPYDITSWSLPLHRGVEAVEINTRIPGIDPLLQPLSIPFSIKRPVETNASWALFTSASNESYKAAFLAAANKMNVERAQDQFSVNGIEYPAGSFLVQVTRDFSSVDDQLLVSPVFLEQKPEVRTTVFSIPRVAIVETWVHDMDGGWTRFIFDQYNIPYTVLRPVDLQNVNLSRNYDILVFTDRAKSIFMDGKGEREGQRVPLGFPPEYSKGMEKKGFENLMSFVNKGGKVIAWGGAVDLFTGVISMGENDSREEFVLPVRNIGNQLSGQGLFVPGALLRLNLRQDHPLTWGMPSQVGAFHRGNPVFRTSIPSETVIDRRVIASFPSDNILISGYAEKENLLAYEPAVVWIRKGEGQIILSSFNPQFRSSMAATYKLLFNALLL